MSSSTYHSSSSATNELHVDVPSSSSFHMNDLFKHLPTDEDKKKRLFAEDIFVFGDEIPNIILSSIPTTAAPVIHQQQQQQQEIKSSTINTSNNENNHIPTTNNSSNVFVFGATN